MGLMDSLKHRFSTNMKVTQLMYMTQPTDIVRFCQSLSREDRADVVKGIESAFKWQPVGQIAQAFFPMQASAGAVVDAVDLAQGGYVSGAVDLMRAQSQNVQPQYGMTAMQQAALSYAWTVLKSMEKQEDMRTWNVPAPQVAVVPSPSTSIAVNFCPSCGRRREAAEKFCPQCGRPLGGCRQRLPHNRRSISVPSSSR